MAKLNPPSISGTLPSFYSNRGAVKITVPFSMNKTVSPNEVGGFSLRIKSANTDTILGIQEVNNVISWSDATLAVSFVLNNKVAEKLIVGQHYKIQLAYKNIMGEVGYYSSLGIAKYTTFPQISINGFNVSSTNLSSGVFTGVYSNLGDSSEKVYQYKFTITDVKGNVIETSGWKLHNTYTDDVAWRSIDEYSLKKELPVGVIYRLQYSIITNNNLELSSPKYAIMHAESIDINLEATLHAELDYENACINLRLQGVYEHNKEKAESGAFVISRASSDTDFSVWTVVHDFRLRSQLPSTFSFRDFTIEQGLTYRYSIQQYNNSKIYSNRKYAEDITAWFEDCYLFDGERQLRIRFNPKITSFKTNYLDTKKTTLGSQFPFIFRNGAVAYKEFPINGLISYAIDNDQYFMTRAAMDMPETWSFTSDIIDENITYERRFKLEVLDWLNDGNIKLFKSPTEGNYLVRLMQVSLTPVEQTSRMIHNFACTANEVAALTMDNLATYNLLNVASQDSKVMNWSSIVLADFVNSFSGANWQELVTQTDLLNGYECHHLRIEDAMPGTIFTIGDSEIQIGITGSYEVRYESPRRGLYIKTPRRGMQGTVTTGVYSTEANKFDSINKLSIYDVPILQVFGAADDILGEYRDIKQTVSRLYFARFSSLDIVPVKNYQALEMKLANLNEEKTNIEFSPYSVYFTLDKGEYYKFEGDTFVKQDGYSNIVIYSINGKQISLSVEQNNVVYIPELNEIPASINIGNGVCAELSFQVKELQYSVEENLRQEKLEYLAALEKWRAYCLNLQVADVSQVRNSSIITYRFENNSFVEMLDTEKEDYRESYYTAWMVHLGADGHEIDYTEDEIAAARTNYLEKKREFVEQLQFLLERQEEGITE